MLIKRPLLLSAMAIALFAALMLGQGIYIHAKAILGQHLIANAWDASLQNGRPQKPWPWMDTWPVVRLSVASLGVEQIVLAGDSGQALAFGPGLRAGSAAPGQPGTTLISGHRDTHFGFLNQLKQGDIVTLADTSGGKFFYMINDIRIVPADFSFFSSGEKHQLVLSTCWPFNDIGSASDKRYLAIGKPVVL